MGEKLKATWVCMLFFLGILYVIEIPYDLQENVSGEIVYVNTTGSNGAYPSIQDAINSADPGTTVYVYSGTYFENIVVNKTINLTGEDSDITVVDGGGSSDVVRITADYVNITGFTVTGSGWFTGDAGIKLNNVQNCRIFNNSATNNEDGISLWSCSGNHINGNTVSGNFGYGIYLNSSGDNNIYGNTALTNRHSIYLDSSNNNDIIDNTIYWNTISGISLYSSSGNTITGNEAILNDKHGIYIQLSNLNSVIGNNVSNNDRGIGLYSSDDNLIRGNDASNNGEGINISSSSNNRIYHNNLIDNMDQAHDDTNSNFWNHFYPLCGNYWSDYGGVDNYKGPNQDILGSDSIGDTNYSIDPDSIDNYPLKKPYPDLFAPRIQLLSPLNNSVIQPGVVLDFNISDDNLYFSNYSINGNPDIPFSEPFDINTNVWEDDNFIIQINAVDLMGNINSSLFFFTIDSNRPFIILKTPENNSIIPSGIILDFSIMDLHLTQVNYSVNGDTNIPLSDPFNISTSGWEDGDYTIQIDSSDSAGNANSSVFFFRIDSTKPIFLLNSLNNNSVIPKGTILDFAVIEPNLAQANYSVNGEENYPFSPPFNISTTGWLDDEYTIQINASDLAGNTNSSLFLFVVDSKKPMIQLNTPENNTIISGETILNLTVVDLNLKHVNYSKNAGANISLSEPFDISPLGWEDGDYTVRVNALDLAGNSNSSLFFFTLDSTPTTIILNSPVNNSALQEITVLDFIVEDANLVAVNYSINGGNNISISEPFNISTLGWENGKYIIQFNSLDKAGNSNCPWFVIIIDSVTPEILLDTPENNSVIPYGDVFSFHVVESNLMHVNYSIDGSRNISISEPLNISIAGWEDGDYTIQVNALDLAGNRNSSWFYFSIDSVKPVVILNSPENNSIVTGDTILYFTIVDSNLMQVSYSINGGADNPLPSPFNISIAEWADGEYTIQVHALDLVGNYNSSLFFFTLDSTNPAILLDTPENNAIISSGTILELKITDEHLLNVNYSINGATDISMSSPYNISTADWDDGDYTIQVNALDLVCNINSSSFSFTLDSTPPTIWFDPAINHSTVPVGRTIQLDASDPHLEGVMYSLDGGGYYVLSPPNIIDTYGWTDGSHIVKLKPRDIAGNEVIRWFEVTIDAAPPYVVSTVLTDQSPDSGIDTLITITFSESMNQTYIEDSVRIFPYADFTWQWNQDGTILSISFPTSELSEGTTYLVMIDEKVADINGNIMPSDFEFVFTTETSQPPPGPLPTPSEESFPYWIIILFAIIIVALISLFLLWTRGWMGEVPEEEVHVASTEAVEREPTPIISGPVRLYQRLRCPKCKGVFKVESRKDLLHIKCPHCGERGRTTKDIDTIPVRPKPLPSIKGPVKLIQRVRCLECMELIKVERGKSLSSIKCQNCGAVGKVAR